MSQRSSLRDRFHRVRHKHHFHLFHRTHPSPYSHVEEIGSRRHRQRMSQLREELIKSFPHHHHRHRASHDSSFARLTEEGAVTARQIPARVPKASDSGEQFVYVQFECGHVRPRQASQKERFERHIRGNKPVLARASGNCEICNDLQHPRGQVRRASDPH